MTPIFDIAAFWPDKHRRLCDNGVPPDRLPAFRRLLDRDMAKLRSATLLSIDGVLDAYRSWSERRLFEPSHPEYTPELEACLPPWSNLFVQAHHAEPGYDAGVHVQSAPLLRGDVLAYTFRTFSRPHGALGVIVHAVPFFVVFSKTGQVVQCEPSLIKQHGEQLPVGMALFVFQLLHCKNIATGSSDYRPRMPKGLRNKSPRISFHTLEIRGADSRYRPHGGASDDTGGAAKHICRGNFAHYTDENKLFGKFTGMFWRPMHIRGNAANGIVGKEYSLASVPPAGANAEG